MSTFRTAADPHNNAASAEPETRMKAENVSDLHVQRNVEIKRRLHATRSKVVHAQPLKHCP